MTLLLSEDIGGGNLTDMMNNRFHELQAFHDHVSAYYILAECGDKISNSKFLCDNRRIFFQTEILKFLGQIFYGACSNHF